MISASKLRRAQERVVGARPFALQMQRVLNSLASRVDPSTHPLLAEREPRPGREVAAHRRSPPTKGSAAASTPTSSRPRAASSPNAGATRSRSGWSAARAATSSSAADSRCASRRSGSSRRCGTPTRSGLPQAAIEEFTSGRASKVFIVYNEFKSVMQQRVSTEQLLPIPKHDGADPVDARRGQALRDAPVAATSTTSTSRARRRSSRTCCRGTSRFRSIARCSSRRRPSTRRA